jgi:DnaJ-class molecular chaperone
MAQPTINYAPETCAWCDGKGRFGESGLKCPACSGMGSLLVAQPSRPCGWCEGKGRMGEYGDRCPTCGGAGWVHVMRVERLAGRARATEPINRGFLFSTSTAVA